MGLEVGGASLATSALVAYARPPGMGSTDEQNQHRRLSQGAPMQRRPRGWVGSNAEAAVLDAGVGSCTPLSGKQTTCRCRAGDSSMYGKCTG